MRCRCSAGLHPLTHNLGLGLHDNNAYIVIYKTLTGKPLAFCFSPCVRSGELKSYAKQIVNVDLKEQNGKNQIREKTYSNFLPRLLLH